MYKAMLIVGALLSTTILACGGPEADAKKMCSCLEGALEKEGKEMEEAADKCKKDGEKIAEKYKDKTADLEKMAKAGEECMKPIMEKMTKKMMGGK